MPGLADFFTQLKRRYQIDHRDLQTIEGERQPIAEAFIRLTLIQNEEQRDKERRLREGRRDEAGAPDANDRTEREFRDERLSSWEDLYTPKTPIDLKAIFDPDSKTPAVNPNRLLVVGRAGIGKSTLCQYIAYQWATDHLFADKFEAVFWIPLRRLDPARYPEARQYRVVEILNTECFKGRLSADNLVQLEGQIDANPERFLFLLDGYDEVLPEVGQGFLQTAFEQLTAQPCCLISSRPHDTADLHGIDRCLELMGFMPEDIEAYIQRFFASPQQSLVPEVAQAKAKTLIDYLKRQPAIWGIAHIPLQLAMICPLHERITRAASLTVSALYHLLVENLFKKLLVREGHSRAHCIADYVHEHTAITHACLAQLALQGMLNNQIVLSQAFVDRAVQTVLPTADARSKAIAQQRLVHSGFLRKLTGCAESGCAEYCFIHLTFQEYFAASSIARVLKAVGASGSKNYEHMHRTILEHRYNPRLQLVWQYVAGHLADDVRALKRFFDIVMTEPRDLLGAYERQLLVHCLAECGEPEGLRLTRDQVLKPLLKAVRDANRDVRSTAAGPLGNIGAAAAIPAVLDGLLLALRDTDKYVRSAAAGAFKNMGAAAATPVVLDGLLLMLRDVKWDVRYAAADAFKNIGMAAAATPVVLDRFLLALRDANEDVRSTAAGAFKNMGAAAATPVVLDGLLLMLRDAQWHVRSAAAAADALGNLGAAAATPAVLDGLLLALRDAQWHVRSAAAGALGNLGAAAATPAVLDELLLMLMLRDANEDVRYAAARALGNLGAAAATPAVLDGLLLMLRDADWHANSAAADALGKIGAAAATPAVLDGLLLMLRDAGGYVRFVAADALGKIGAAAATPAVLDGLLLILRDVNWDLRSAAAGAFKNMGAAAATSAVLDGLLLALRDAEWNVRYAAAGAFKNMGAAAATPAVLDGLLLALRDANGQVRSDAAGALGKLGAGAATPAVLDGLLLMLRDAYGNVRSAAAGALGNIDAATVTPAVLDGLLLALRDAYGDVRYAAAGAFKNMGAAAAIPAVLDGLLLALQDANWCVRSVAAEVLGKTGSAAVTPDVLDGLLLALRDENWHVRSAAAGSLGNIDAVAATPAVLDGLLLALRDKDEYVRSAVIHVFKKISVAIDSATFFLSLPLACAGQETLYTAVSTALAYRFAAQNTALFYDPSSGKLCCWEKGKRQQFKLLSASRDFLIREIQKAWVENIHLPLTALPPLADTPLHEAAAIGHLLQVQVLLAESPIDLDNQHNERGFTPLMCAVQARHIEVVQVLVEAGANIALVSQLLLERSNTGKLNTNFEAAVRLAEAPKPTPHEEEISAVLLMPLVRHRQRITIDTLQTWLNTLVIAYQNTPENDDMGRQNLLHAQIGRWTRDADLDTKRYKERWNYLGHLDSIRGCIQVPDGTGVNLDAGLIRNDFLSLRIRLYAELFLRVKLGILHVSELPAGLSQLQIQVLLKSECLGMLETLYNIYDTRPILLISDQTNRKRLLQAQALNIAEKLATLVEGEHYECAAGHDGHSVYLLFIRQGEELIAQLNNVGDGKEFHNKNATREFFPFWVGTFRREALKDPRFLDYLIHVLQAESLPRYESFSKLYTETLRRGDMPALFSQWPPKPEQVAQNCVAHSHNIGLECRFILKFGTEHGVAVYEWLLQQERQLIVRYYPYTSASVSDPAVGGRATGAGDRSGETTPSISLAAVASHHGVFAAPAAVTPPPSTFTHEQLMRHFAQALQVDYQEVFVGIAVEQALVCLANIDHDQTGAMFRRQNEEITWFKLKLTDAGLNKFATHYQVNFPGLIQQVHARDGEWIRIDMNTQLLADRIVPALKRYREAKEEERSTCTLS